jgi:hypothetical protein
MDLNYIRNEKIREELGVKPVLIQIRQYKEKCSEFLKKEWKNIVSQEQHGNINQREEVTREGQECGGLLSRNRPWGLDHEDDDDDLNYPMPCIFVRRKLASHKRPFL